MLTYVIKEEDSYRFGEYSKFYCSSMMTRKSRMRDKFNFHEYNELDFFIFLSFFF